MAIFLHTVEEIFRDYSGRRTGILRALTNEVDHFFQLCDPDKENLCLFGHPNESWEVKEPASEVPTELPDPVLGINYPRDEVPREVWLSLIAAHSDSWLLSLAFFHSARAGLGRDERRYLFSLINELPTIFDVVTGRKPIQDKPRMAGGSKSEASSSRKRSIDRGKMKIDHDFCGSCGRKYSADGFWIFCDFCQRWYHGMCVKMTPSKGKSIKKFKCPSCSIDRALCRSCGGEYKEDGVWIFCDDCQRWFHGMCVNITPAKAKSIKQYKCPYCSLKGMPW